MLNEKTIEQMNEWINICKNKQIKFPIRNVAMLDLGMCSCLERNITFMFENHKKYKKF